MAIHFLDRPRAALVASTLMIILASSGCGGDGLGTDPLIDDAGDASALADVTAHDAAKEAATDGRVADAPIDVSADAHDASDAADAADVGDASDAPDASDAADAYDAADAAACAIGQQDNDHDGTCSPACTSVTCSGHGSCADATGTAICVCTGGYTGASCDACTAGLQDNDHDGTCSPACGAGTCANGGTCDDSTGAAVCTCVDGHTGTSCGACGGGLQDNDNNGTCTASCDASTCNTHGVCSDASGTATCTCSGGYTGAFCASCAAGAQDNDGDGTCAPACDPSTCSGHGACSDASGAATCSCTGGFAGATCSACAPGTQDNDGDGTCAPACGIASCGGQVCSDTSGQIVCSCDALHVGARCEYRLVYDLAVDAKAKFKHAGDVPYLVDQSANTLPYDRVAYKVTLDGNSVWAEMDPFTPMPSKLGVPVDWIFDTTVTNLTVTSNVNGVASVTNAAGGKIHMWPNCYQYDAGLVWGANDVVQTNRDDCYGAMQVFDGASTVFAFNDWAGSVTSNDDIGIGNGTGGALPEWTFSGNAGSYASRRLQVYVREVASCEANTCGASGTCTMTSGVPACACSAGDTTRGCSGICEVATTFSSCSKSGNLDCNVNADGISNISCAAGSTQPYCDFTGSGCTTNGCVKNAVLTYAFAGPVTLDKVRIRSDWWTKRAKNWEVWVGQSATDTPGNGAVKVYAGVAAVAPWVCTTGQACTDEVPDACCPNGRSQSQDTTAVGTTYPKWDKATFTAASGQYWYIVVKDTYAAQYFVLQQTEFDLDTCP